MIQNRTLTKQWKPTGIKHYIHQYEHYINRVKIKNGQIFSGSADETILKSIILLYTHTVYHYHEAFQSALDGEH